MEPSANCNYNCAICLNSTNSNSGTGESDTSSLPKPKCTKLETQLNGIFLLKNIFKVKLDQLEVHLQKWGNPGEWVKLCEKCEEDVTDLRRIYGRLQDITREFERAKLNVEEKIRNSEEEEIGIGVREVLRKCRSKFRRRKKGAGKSKNEEVPEDIVVKAEIDDFCVDDDDSNDSSPWNSLLESNCDDPNEEPESISKKPRQEASFADLIQFQKQDRGTLNPLLPAKLRGQTTQLELLFFEKEGPDTDDHRQTDPGANPEAESDPPWNHDLGTEDNTGSEGTPESDFEPEDESSSSSAESEVPQSDSDFEKESASEPHRPRPPKRKKKEKDPTEPKVKSKIRKKEKQQRPSYPTNLDLLKVTLSEDKLSGTCNICDKHFATMRKLKKHMHSVHDKRFSSTCEHCGKQCSTGNHLRAHLARIHGIGEFKKCGLCHLVYFTEAGLKTHKCYPVPQPTQKEFICDVCGLHLKSSRGLSKHVRITHNEEVATNDKYQCHLCGKNFCTRGNLTKHVRAVHEKQLPYKCELCGHSSGSKSDLLRHRAGKHSVGDFKCDVEKCSKVFGMKCQLEEHVKTVHEKVKNYSCNTCGKGFARMSKLRDHELAVHINKEHKPFACELCGKSFATEGYRTYHLKHCHKLELGRKLEVPADGNEMT